MGCLISRNEYFFVATYGGWPRFREVLNGQNRVHSSVPGEPGPGAEDRNTPADGPDPV